MDENNFQTFNQQPQGFQQPVVEQPINNGFQTQPQPQPQPKKKKGGITALIIILIVLLLACGGAAAYYFLVVKTPKTAINTFLDTIDSKLGEATELIEGNTELDSFKFSINVDPAADIETNSKQVVNILNNSDVQVGLGIDKANKKAIFMLQVNYNNDPVAISLYFDSTTKAVYVYSEAIYGKTIKVAELSDEAIESLIDSLSNTTDAKNYVKAAQIAVKAIKNNIKDEYISSSEASFNANGKEVKATKNTIHLTEDSTKELEYKVCKELLNNSEFINTFKGQMQTSMKDALNKAITNYESGNKSDTTGVSVANNVKSVDFSVYTEGFIPKAVRYELTTTIETSVIYNTYYNNSLYSTSTKLPDEDIAPSTSVPTTSTVAINIIDDNNYELISKVDEKETKVDIKIKSSDRNNGEVSFITENENLGTMSINVSYKRELNRDIPTVSSYNSVELGDLTTADFQKILTDLSKHEVTKPISQFVSLLLMSSMYQQSGSGSLYNYPTTLPTTTTPNTTTTSGVPAGKQKVGDKDNGYVLIPSNWTRFIDPDATQTLQYSYANLYILTMMNTDTTKLSAYQYASNYAKSIQSEGITPTTAMANMGNYTAYQVYARYTSDNTWLVAWFFETPNGKTHCISVEGPDASNEAFKIPDTFTLE